MTSPSSRCRIDANLVLALIASCALAAWSHSTETLPLPHVAADAKEWTWAVSSARARVDVQGAVFVVDEHGDQVAEGVHVQTRCRAAGRHLEWTIEVKNTTASAAHLTAGVRLRMMAPRAAIFFDGLRIESAGDDVVANDNIRGTFPASCLVFDGIGVALGLAPNELVSWFEHRLTPEDNAVVLQCSVRMALETHERGAHTFLLYGFEAPFGHRDALQVYYDEFPGRFRRLPDVDPRVDLNGATYQAWTANSPEICRRMFAGWEWCYAPFRRTGDWYGREERWNYQPARPFAKWRAVDRATFLRQRRDRFARGRRCDVAMLFYLPSCIWVETQLVKQDYPEAVIHRNGKPYALTRPWVTGHDNESLVFPWGNRLADDSMRDMKDLVEDLDIAGFAFDTADGGWPYRGPAIADSPGRAWDDQGPFCDVSIAIAKLMDYVHTLHKDGRRMALVANPGASTTFMLPFRSDSAMMEKPPYRSVETHLLPLRRLLGHKTMVWWDDWTASRVLRWRQMSGDEIAEALRGMRDYTVLASLYYGGIPTPRLCMGVPKLMSALPVIVELVRAGWQPTPGAVTDPPSDLWITRYGERDHSYLAVCNQTASRFRGELVVRDDYLEAPSPRFLLWDGKSVPQHRKGNATRIRLDLPSRGWTVFRLSPPRIPADEAIMGFPFERAEIRIPSVPSAEDEYAAFRLQEYFRFYYARAVTPPREVVIPIVRGNDGGSRRYRILVGDRGPVRKGNTLEVPRAWAKLQLLLRDLDRRYRYVGRFPTSGEAEGEAELLRKAGVAGSVLE